MLAHYMTNNSEVMKCQRKSQRAAFIMRAPQVCPGDARRTVLDGGVSSHDERLLEIGPLATRFAVDANEIQILPNLQNQRKPPSRHDTLNKTKLVSVRDST
jgi:hypothetical protein